jgi:hypothetical protein
LTVIDGKIPIAGYKTSAPTLRCGECKTVFIGQQDFKKYIKTIPEDYLKNWDNYRD